jgi:glycosyltransferase involved in cell wall biosynthesis
MALVQVEAMLCGTPVVASDIPGARVVVRETGFGRLAPPHDPNGLALAIVETLQHRARYRPTRSAVRAVFDTDRTIRQYEELLLQLARRRDTAAPRVPTASPRALP